MSKVFIISDLHLGHSATCLVFKRPDGSPLRPFASLEEMHAAIIERWNGVVGSGDLVLVLGDVAFSGQAYDTIMPKLAGSKRLIRGNHDRFSEGRYRKHFDRIEGCYIRDRYMFTHVPVHTACIERFDGNIHGHLHANHVMDGDRKDHRYFNASCEQIDFTPIGFEEVKREMRKAALDALCEETEKLSLYD